jgi:hypothetical protein
LALEFLLSQAQARWRTAEAAVVMVAAASVEEAFTAAASVEEVSAAAVSVAFAAALMAGAFAAVLTGVASAAVAFVMVDFTVIGSGIAGSMTSFSSVILGTRSFTIPIHTTDTIPTDIILTVTDTILTINLFTKAELDIPTL